MNAPRRCPRLAVLLGVVALSAALPTRLRGGESLGAGLFAGYSFARVADVDRHGAALSADFGLAGPLAAFADASAQRGGSGGLDRDDLTLMAGPGVRFARGRAVLFARALAGLVRDSAAVDVLDVRISESSTRFAAMGGGGVDLRLSGRWGARVQGDYVWHDAQEGTRSGFRVSAGAVCRFGAAP